MSSEFKMGFAFHHHYYSARVLAHFSEDRTTYAVRPTSSDLAKGYGQQTLIYKENDAFSCDSNLNRTNPGYVGAIISALKAQRK